MQPFKRLKSTGKVFIGLSLLIVPAIYSCNNDTPNTEPAKADSSMTATPPADSTMRKDTLKKDTIPAVIDTSKGGQIVPTTQTRPPKN